MFVEKTKTHAHSEIQPFPWEVKWIDYAIPSLLYISTKTRVLWFETKHIGSWNICLKFQSILRNFQTNELFLWLRLPLSSPAAQAQPGLSELNRLLEKEKYFRPKVEYFSLIVASNEDYTAISQNLAIFIFSRNYESS